MANSNGWGDGSVNNNIGWGQGANNTIGWGKSHINSWAGATDIDGGNLPSNSVAPALSGTAQEGQTLTCSTGTWSGSPTYTYQWKRNGSNIGSATNSTYTLVTADVGQSIKCTVTATNFIGSATADSNTVTPTSSVDADAQAFITAASITDPTQQSAINQLVVDLKGYSIWSKMKALYPFVGGTASAHKFNLKDPRDLDAAFRLVFSGGVTHASTGATFNGTNGYADTFLNPSTALLINNAHTSIYSRTNSDFLGIAIGSEYNGSQRFVTWLRTSNTSYLINNSNSPAAISNSDSRGLFVNNRISSTGTRGTIRGTIYAQTIASAATYANANINIGRSTNGGYYDNREYAFASIGDGLLDSEANNLYLCVQQFNTTLGRQV